MPICLNHAPRLPIWVGACAVSILCLFHAPIGRAAETTPLTPPPVASGDVFILGDDGAAGTAADAQFSLDPADFIKSLTNKSSTPVPHRTWPAAVDFSGSFEWVTETLRSAFAAVFLEFPASSGLTKAAGAMGYPMDQIIVAARTGETSDMAEHQYFRAIQAAGGRAPSQVLVQFGISDVCLGVGGTTTADGFRKNITRLVDRIESTASFDKPIDILLVSPPSLTSVLSAPDILDKRIMAGGRIMSCRDYRRNALGIADTPVPDSVPTASRLLIRRLALVPVATCPAAFVDPTSTASATLVEHMANTLRGYREVLSSFAAERHAHGVIHVKFASSAADLAFAPSEVAADCLHIGASGQSRIAESILKDWQKNP